MVILMHSFALGLEGFFSPGASIGREEPVGGVDEEEDREEVQHVKVNEKWHGMSPEFLDIFYTM